MPFGNHLMTAKRAGSRMHASRMKAARGLRMSASNHVDTA